MTPINVFVLCTGRCGSTTFARACQHLSNFTVGHESRVDRLGPDRLAYPEGHIEVDNRLSWMLGRLGAAFADKDTLWVHLFRDEEETAQSFAKRFGRGIIRAYAKDIVPSSKRHAVPIDVCRDYCRTVTANIEAFVAGRPHVLTVRLETVGSDFDDFLARVGAEGDLTAARAEWAVRHNAS